jgi:hypothetical protein
MARRSGGIRRCVAERGRRHFGIVPNENNASSVADIGLTRKQAARQMPPAGRG